jgi:hypothetical protein
MYLKKFGALRHLIGQILFVCPMSLKGWLTNRDGAPLVDPYAFVPPKPPPPPKVGRPRTKPILMEPVPLEDTPEASAARIAQLAELEREIVVEEAAAAAAQKKHAKRLRVNNGALWTKLLVAHAPLAGLVLKHFKSAGYASTKVLFRDRVVAAVGCDVNAFIPRQTLERWQANQVAFEPIKLGGSGGKKPKLSALQLDLLYNALIAFCAAGIPVTWKTTFRHACAILARSGQLVVGDSFPSRAWCRNFCRRRGFTRRKGTKAARKQSAEEDAAVVERYLLQTAALVEKHKIPRELVINADETPVLLVDLGQFTLAPRGDKQVRILGTGDKRNVTVTLCTTASGHTLGLQVIWNGKEGSKRAIPKVVVPSDWLQVQTPTHWQNERTWAEHFTKVVLPYIKATRLRLGTPEQPAIYLIDTHTSHLASSLRELCKQNFVILRFIVPGMTGEMQPLDVGINSLFKLKLTGASGAHFENKLLLWQVENPDSPPVLFEKMLQKSEVGPLIVEALKLSDNWLKSNNESARNAHKHAWAIFDCCWDAEFRAKAKAAEETGILFQRSLGARGEEVLAILLKAVELVEAEKNPQADNFGDVEDDKEEDDEEGEEDDEEEDEEDEDEEEGEDEDEEEKEKDAGVESDDDLPSEIDELDINDEEVQPLVRKRSLVETFSALEQAESIKRAKNHLARLERAALKRGE